MRWYSVSVLSNFEKKVAEAIKDAVAQQHLENEIAEVLVPTEEVIEIRRGKKVQTEKRFMPGYVLVKMELSDRTYHLINSINRVTGFLGPQGKPSPMKDDEVARMEAVKRGGLTEVNYLDATDCPGGLPCMVAFADLDGDGAFLAANDVVIAGPEPLPRGIQLWGPLDAGAEGTNAIVGWVGGLYSSLPTTTFWLIHIASAAFGLVAFVVFKIVIGHRMATGVREQADALS